MRRIERTVREDSLLPVAQGALFDNHSCHEDEFGVHTPSQPVQLSQGSYHEKRERKRRDWGGEGQGAGGGVGGGGEEWD